MTPDQASSYSIDHAGLEVIDVDECHRLLVDSTVARVAFVDRGEPVILPILITMIGDGIYFRSQLGSKLEVAVMSRPVAIEIDGFDTAAHSGWSVLVKGTATTVADAGLIDRLDAQAPTSWLGPERPQEWIRVMANEVTGRRIVT